jgi:acyl-CoA reductase-like NAD-dependent aldehyde dehydrogenase
MAKGNRTARGKEAHTADLALINEIKNATAEYKELAVTISEAAHDKSTPADERAKVVSDAVEKMNALKVRIAALDGKINGKRKYDTRR